MIVSRGANLFLAAGGNFIADTSIVVLENITLTGDDENEAAEEFVDGAIRLRNGASLALIGSSLSFLDPGDATIDAQCITVESNSFLVVDRSKIVDCDGGGIEVSGGSAFISNSLFQSNGTLSSSHGALTETIQSPNGYLVFGCTFDGNQSINANLSSSILGPCAGRLTIEGSIMNNNNSLPFVRLAVGCDINNSLTFGFPPPGGNNFDADPQFIPGTFNLSSNASPAVDRVTPPPVPFDSNVLFSNFGLGNLNQFGHDFDGKPRPLGNAIDMGMFEDF